MYGIRARLAAIGARFYAIGAAFSAVDGFVFIFSGIGWLAPSRTIGVRVEQAEEMPSLEEVGLRIKEYARFGKISQRV